MVQTGNCKETKEANSKESDKSRLLRLCRVIRMEKAMKYILQAACICDKGVLRSNNEDNYCFDGDCMKKGRNGLAKPATLRVHGKAFRLFAVFDGMGGELFGEEASYAAAKSVCSVCKRGLSPAAIDETAIMKIVNDANMAVVQRARALQTQHMGCTLAMLCVTPERIHICNVGDSRIYRLRNGSLECMSRDDAAISPLNRGRKPPLTQCLGIDPDEMRLDPHFQETMLRQGDCYLLCSDGLTDMLSERQISEIMCAHVDVTACAAALCSAALEHGGRDNITVLVCKTD